MRIGPLEAGTATRIITTGKSVLTSGPCSILGVAFVGTGTGQVQFFGNTAAATLTADISLSPAIVFSSTSTAVLGGFSPMFMRYPAEYSKGSIASSGVAAITDGLIVDAGATTDPNLIIFWSPNVRV